MQASIHRFRDLLRDYLLPQRGRVFVLAALLLGDISLDLFNPQVIRFFIDTARDGGATETLVKAALLFLSIGVITQITSLLTQYVSEDVGWRATNRMRHDLVDHCLRLDMPFHQKHTPGEMIERIDGDVTTMASFFSVFVMRIVGNGIMLVGVLALICREDWRIGVALTVVSFASMTILMRVKDIAVPAFTAEREATAELFGYAEERFGGVEDLRPNGAIDDTMRRLHLRQRELYRHSMRASILGHVLWTVTYGTFIVSLTITLIAATSLFRQGVFTIGTVYLVVHYTWMLLGPIEDIIRRMQDLQRATAGIDRVDELRKEQPTIHDHGTARLPDGALSVEFDGVTFGYETDDPILHDVSFALNAGTTLGLLGRTGSGKTTITRLLLRLYDVQQGSVRIGGTDARQLRFESLRRSVSVVTQDVQLFRATVRDNLTLFDERADDERIVRVIKELGLTAWYDGLADGLDTVIDGDGGLSAGEAQLLAFARVFLNEPGLVLLDEPSSRMDPATEAQLDRAMARLLEERTGIVIAHRLQTVRRVDHVLILDAGRIVEFGERVALERDPDSRFSQLLKTGLEEALA